MVVKRKKDAFLIEDENIPEQDLLDAADEATTNQPKKKRKVQDSDDEEDETEAETIDEKRIRLARAYLDRVGATAEEESDDDDFNEQEFADDAVGRQLRKQALRLAGKEKARSIIAKYDYSSILESPPTHRILRAHRLPTTCLALSEDDKIAFTGSKDRSIVQYDIETGTKTLFTAGRGRNKTPKSTGHSDEVLDVTVSSDNVYLASAGRDKCVRVYDIRSREEIHTFRQHLDAVTCCAFRKDSLSLYSGSADRTVNVYNIEQGSFVETLYGHQATINSMTSLYQERVITGGDDSTVRIWKIEQESQLLFRGQPTLRSIDSVSALTSDVIFSGAQDGSLLLWSTAKKRPVDTIKNGHSKWINSTAALYATDLVVSGSSDGFIRGWKSEIGKNKLSSVFNIPVEGHVNALAIGSKGRFIAAAIGQEHRLGRWDRIQSARNGLHLFDMSHLALQSIDDESEDEGTNSDIEEEEEDEYILG